MLVTFGTWGITTCVLSQVWVPVFNKSVKKARLKSRTKERFIHRGHIGRGSKVIRRLPKSFFGSWRERAMDTHVCAVRIMGGNAHHCCSSFSLTLEGVLATSENRVKYLSGRQVLRLPGPTVRFPGKCCFLGALCINSLHLPGLLQRETGCGLWFRIPGLQE